MQTSVYLLPEDVRSLIFVFLTFFVILGIFFVIYICWRTKTSLNQIVSFAVLFLLVVSIPATVLTVFYQHNIESNAQKQIRIENLQIVTKKDHTTLISFTTIDSAYVYLEYMDYSNGQKRIIMPIKGLSRNTIHVFKFTSSTSGAQITLFVDGQEQIIDGKPIRLSQ